MKQRHARPAPNEGPPPAGSQVARCALAGQVEALGTPGRGRSLIGRRADTPIPGSRVPIICAPRSGGNPRYSLTGKDLQSTPA